MSTLYSDVYNSFLNKITDYDFLQLDVEDRDSILNTYLKASIIKFNICKNDLSDRDEALKQFNETLTDEEIEILANLMIVEWLKPRINLADMFKQQMSSKDFNMFSPANLQKENRETYNNAKAEVNKLIVKYSYSSGSLEDLT